MSKEDNFDYVLDEATLGQEKSLKLSTLSKKYLEL